MINQSFYKSITWTSLIAGVLVLVGAGSLYAFSAYSVALKKQMNYTETEINTVSAIGSVGQYLTAIPVGMFFDKFGARPTIGLGTLLLFGTYNYAKKLKQSPLINASVLAGYFLMYEAVRGAVSTHFIVVGIYMFLVGIGNYFVFAGDFVTNLKNWHTQHRGKVSGVLFGAFGLSAAIITQLFKLFFVHDGQEDLVGFFLSLSIGLGFLGFLGFLSIHSVPLLMTDERTPLLGDDFEHKPIEKTQGRQGIFGTIGGTKLLKVPEFYLLFLSFFICAGVGFSFINILGGIITSWKVEELSSVTFVIILSLSNFSGRLIMGNLIDLLRKKLPLSGIMIVPAVLVGAGYALIAVWHHFVALVIATILIASSYGAFWTGYNSVLNNFFGDTYHGSNFGYLSGAAGAGAILMNIVAGKIYDSEVDHTGDNNQCYGTMCYLYTFILAGGLVVMALIMLILLTLRERRQAKLKSISILVN